MWLLPWTMVWSHTLWTDKQSRRNKTADSEIENSHGFVVASNANKSFKHGNINTEVNFASSGVLCSTSRRMHAFSNIIQLKFGVLYIFCTLTGPWVLSSSAGLSEISLRL